MKEVNYFAFDSGSQTLREFLENDLKGKYDEEFETVTINDVKYNVDFIHIEDYKIDDAGKRRTEITPDKELIDELVKKIENKEYIMICRLQWWQRAIKQIKMFFIR